MRLICIGCELHRVSNKCYILRGVWETEHPTPSISYFKVLANCFLIFYQQYDQIKIHILLE